MNSKFKKIISATLITTASAAMIGCGTPNTKLAKNIDKGMAEFVSSINNLDYVDTASENNLGKIVETAAVANSLDDQYLTQTLEELNIDNAITIPSERDDNFKLFILSEQPFISFTSSDNSATINMQLNFSTEKISNASNEINTKINNLILKRSILMIYVNEIYNNRVNLNNENRVAINAYVNVIKENASYLSGNRGMVNNQLTLASDLVSSKSNNNLINYYMIKSGEALETRLNKIDSTISAINSIIEIIENNLDASSIYYQASLSKTYENIIENLKPSTNVNNTSTENKELADNIANSLSICDECDENINSANQISTTQNDTTIKNATTLNNRTITNPNVNNNTKTSSNKNLTNQNLKQTKNSQTNITANQNNSNQEQINQNTTNENATNQNNLNAKNSTNSQNQTSLKNKNGLTNSQIETSQNQIKNNDLQKRKSANTSQNNQNLRSNTQNTANFKQNQIQNTPTTLDIPRDNSLNMQRQKSQDTFDIDRSNRKNQTEVNSRTNLLDDSNHSTNSQISNTTNNRRRNTSNPQIKNTHENIKRVPYIRTLD